MPSTLVEAVMVRRRFSSGAGVEKPALSLKDPTELVGRSARDIWWFTT